MTKMLFLTLIFAPCFSQATDLVFETYNPKTKSYDKVVVQEYQGLKISKNCFKKNKPSCMAWSAVKKPVRKNSSPTELLGHPAAIYCGNQKALDRIYKSADQSETDYCVFADGSSIDSWDLYYKHHKK